jgi:CheY-like chemotaxis protein
VPIVALTANLMANERDECLKAGMDDYVPKPFTHDDIRHVLERVMTNASVLRMA